MLKDIRFALRSMAANPGVTVTAVLTLALGIVTNTAMFSVIHALLLKPLPVVDPGRLTMIWARIPRMNIVNAFAEYNTFAEWRAARSFESMAAYARTSGNLAYGDQPQRLKILRVTSEFPGRVRRGPGHRARIESAIAAGTKFYLQATR
jgi:hypothetical protein